MTEAVELVLKPRFPLWPMPKESRAFNMCTLCLGRIELTVDERGERVWTHRDPMSIATFEKMHLPRPAV